MMKWMIACVAVLALSASGCNQPSPPVTPAGGSGTTVGQADSRVDALAGKTSDHDHGGILVYCVSCGEAAHTKSCCNDAALKCLDCGRQAGAPLCCKDIDPSLAGSELCSKCGQVVGKAECCAQGAEICKECGLHAGAPLCCKL